MYVNERSPSRSSTASNNNSFKNKYFKNGYNQNWKAAVIQKYLVT